MRFSPVLSMTSDRGLVGDAQRPRSHWDLSFLDADHRGHLGHHQGHANGHPRPSPSRPLVVSSPSSPAAAAGCVRKTSCDAAFAFCNQQQQQQPVAHHPDGGIVVRRHSVIPPSGGGGTVSGVPGGRAFHGSPETGAGEGAGESASGGGTRAPLGLNRTSDEGHVYQNGGQQPLDNVYSANDVILVDRMSKITTVDDGFFFPVLHSPRPLNPGSTAASSALPWVMVTPSGSETDPTESRSQSISSQDSSSDQDVLTSRVRDDSGIGVMWCHDSVPRRNSSAPALNDLSVVVCRPSPSPLIEFPHGEPLLAVDPDSRPVDLKRVDLRGVDSVFADSLPGHNVYMRVARFLPSWDLERLSLVFHRLNICRFYLGKLTFDDAKVLLRGFPVGTFLLRDSSDSHFLFSLSVQTTRGTTSIRVIYEAGHFRLDCDSEQIHLMPTFDCVIGLLRHYVRLASAYGRRRLATGAGGPGGGGPGPPRNNFVFLESTGRKDTPVLLRRAFASRPAPLKHLCRLRINNILGFNNVDRLQLIPSLKTFLKEYPYDI